MRDFESAIRIVCEPDMDIFGVADRFLSCNFPLLPVVEGEKLVGVISRRDALRGVEQLRGSYVRKSRRFEQVAGNQANRPRGIENLQRAAANHSTPQLVQLFGRRT